jgi:hypothetical protein
MMTGKAEAYLHALSRARFLGDAGVEAADEGATKIDGAWECPAW